MEFSDSPPPHWATAAEDVSLDSITVSTSSPPSTYTDAGEQDTCCAEESRNDKLSQTAYSASTGCDDSPSLRGGASYRPPKVTELKQAAASSEDELESGEEDSEVDYEGLDDVSEDDSNSTSSDWDSYGSLPLTMDEYNAVVARLEGSEDWNAEQKKLHKLIYMRGLHPMLPSWWRLSFKMWGVTQPHLDDVFTPKHSRKRVAIHAYGNELDATKALESLFYLSQTVTDYEEIGYQNKISSTVVKGIRSYINWSLRDARIDKSKTQLNMLVQAYSQDFRGDDEYESTESDFAPSSASGNEDAETPGIRKDDTGYDSLSAAQRQRRFTRAVSRDLERRLLHMGQRWRTLLRDDHGKGYIAQPPTLYAFAVVQHIVMLASHDPGASTNPVVVLDQVRLNDRGQWLWNALSIALPVNMARDALCRLWDTGLIVEEQTGSDPDL
ncbi:hypothetical protein VTK56DRAFT_264 [Thermocarpiscus australiensis]